MPSSTPLAAPGPLQGAVSTLRWEGGADGTLVLVDQTRLPGELVFLECREVEHVFEAIRALRVRGAPAIGVAAAYGLCLALRDRAAAELPACFQAALARLAESRPTAVNLFWALDRMNAVASQLAGRATADAFRQALLHEAQLVEVEDVATCQAIGQHGAALLADGTSVLTHCNAGALATAGDGTALAPIFAAHAAGKRLHVFVDETRPLLQGARLTSWELMQRGIACTLICDSMAAQVMREGRVQAVLVGADRIAASGDTANKIGTYGVAVLAQAHHIPFYVAAPTATFDLARSTGAEIPIEQRAAEEITCGFGRRTAPAGVSVYNPAFDVTPAALIRAIICERGLVTPVDRPTIERLLRPAGAAAAPAPPADGTTGPR